jgi:hypothetical protein
MALLDVITGDDMIEDFEQL